MEVTTRLPAHVASPGLARRFVTDAVQGGPCRELADDLALLTSEVVTNAVLHAGTDIEVCIVLTDEGVVRVEVADADPTGPTATNEQAVLATGGRGLTIVGALARSWGVRVVPAGKSVWFELATGTPQRLSDKRRSRT